MTHPARMERRGFDARTLRARMERRGFSPCVAVLACLAALVLAACGPVAVGTLDDLGVTLRVEPPAPIVGRDAVVTVDLRDREGAPLRAATLELEAHMTHPGMVPVIAPLAEGGDGRYQASATFTMAGEWVLFIAGRLQDGRPLRQQVAGLTVMAPE